jgi:anti-sigma B factor antagonist/stage II sporulation protein AA (anti-sigma F factor antagonist)
MAPTLNHGPTTMTLEQDLQGSVLILRPVGRLDSSSAPELERVVIEHLGQGTKQLMFDLSDMDYVSSAGLRVILLAGKKLRTAQGKLVLVGLREMVREVFEMSGFMSLFPVEETVAEGLTRF